MIVIMANFRRKQSLTHEAFRDYYEGRHVPLVSRLLPEFSEYRRYYVADAEMQEKLGYDVVTIACFDSVISKERSLRMLAQPEIASCIAADEAQFMERSATKIFSVDVFGIGMDANRGG